MCCFRRAKLTVPAQLLGLCSFPPCSSSPGRAGSSTQPAHEHRPRAPMVLPSAFVWSKAKPGGVTRVSYKFQGSSKPQTPSLTPASRANACSKKKKEVHRAIWAGRDLRRSIAQPLPQSRASYRTGSGYLGPYPVRS